MKELFRGRITYKLFILRYYYLTSLILTLIFKYQIVKQKNNFIRIKIKNNTYVDYVTLCILVFH